MSDPVGWKEALPRYNQPHLRLRQVAKLVQQCSPTHMVDLGCATGILRTLCPGVNYRGCDFVSPDTPPDFPFIACDFNSQSLPDEFHHEELIVCSGILEYLENLPQFLRTLRDRLQPGGHLIATYFNLKHLSRLWPRLRGKKPFIHPDWRGLYAPHEITELLTDAGFTLTRLIPMNHALGSSPPVEATIHAPLKLPAARFWSPWLAHQFLYVAQRPDSEESAS